MAVRMIIRVQRGRVRDKKLDRYVKIVAKFVFFAATVLPTCTCRYRILTKTTIICVCNEIFTFSSLQMRTTITVAHRLSSVAHCDKILVLQKGRVVEQGTHHELMHIVDGVYRNMWNIQNHVVNEKNNIDGTYNVQRDMKYNE